MQPVRWNWAAILVAAVAYFVVEGVWFTLLMHPWLAGIGRTMQEIQNAGVSPVLQYGIGFVASLATAATISYLTQISGPQTAARGMKIAFILWAGLVLTAFAAEYAFEARSVMTLVVVTGAPLIGMLIEGAIVGGWKVKAKS